MTTIYPDLRLSEHFVLREFVRSATAQRLHIDNTPQLCHVTRLIALCDHVLEPLRNAFGPIVINSGYRCEALNRAVGGVPTSQHLRGEAADVRTATREVAIRMYNYVRDNLVFDQLILERNKRTGTVWLHVSYRKDELRNRRQALHLSMAANTTTPLTCPTAAETLTPLTATATAHCICCGQTLPKEKFALLPSGNRRHMCNHCRWKHHIEPSRHRALLRALTG